MEYPSRNDAELASLLESINSKTPHHAQLVSMQIKRDEYGVSHEVTEVWGVFPLHVPAVKASYLTHVEQRGPYAGTPSDEAVGF